MGKAIGAGVVVLVVLGMVMGFERAKQPDANKVLADEVTPTVTEINLQDKLTMAEVAKHNDETIPRKVSVDSTIRVRPAMVTGETNDS
jgi:hypothetical protein